MILLVLQRQACGLSEVTAWLPSQSPFWLQCGENDSLSVKKKSKMTSDGWHFDKIQRGGDKCCPSPHPKQIN